MSELVKITELSGRYGISARTLRYYEDMGLIVSTRNDEYAYRLYDESSVKRLEQILILRRLLEVTGKRAFEKAVQNF